jgi:hypothetical protein
MDRTPHKRSGGDLRSPLDRCQNGMSNRERRRVLSKASRAGVIREHASPCETRARNKRTGAGLFNHQLARFRNT